MRRHWSIDCWAQIESYRPLAVYFDGRRLRRFTNGAFFSRSSLAIFGTPLNGRLYILLELVRREAAHRQVHGLL
jgi:hypothetical protein